MAMAQLAVDELDLDAVSSADEVDEEVSDSDEYDYEADDPDAPQLQAGCQGQIPYVAVYDDEDATHARGYFIPGLPVQATVDNCERDSYHHHHMLNPHVYTLGLNHGPYTWSIRRRYNDFQHLHRRMILHRANERLKAPVRRIKEHRDQKKLEAHLEETLGKDDEDDTKPTEPKDDDAGEDQAGIRLSAIKPALPPTDPPAAAAAANANATGEEEQTEEPGKRRYKLRRVPKFPLFPDAILQDSQIEDRKRRLEKYLRQLLRTSGYRNHPETAEFLEVSRLSFVANLGAKTREGLVKKRPGGRKAYHGCTRCCVEHCARWSKRWLVIKDSFVAYLDPDHEEVRAVLLYDKDFAIRVGASQTEGVKHGLLIQNQQRDLLLKCETERRAEEWRDAIQALTHAEKGPARLWLQEKRFNSTFPPRQAVYANWFVDARQCWEQVANMLELAKEEILIADWWLSPEVYMKRPMAGGNRWLLTEILKRRAEAGIHIFILLYKEVEMALGLNSLYSKRTLQNLHPNIRVMRHPDHVPGSNAVMLWAHHEKLIVVDQMAAFVGGIDLCYGRWDDHRHRLTDLGSVQYHSQKSMGQGAHSIISGFRQMAGVLPTLSPTLERGEMANGGDQSPKKEKEEPTELPTLEEAVASAQCQMGLAPISEEESDHRKEGMMRAVVELAAKEHHVEHLEQPAERSSRKPSAAESTRKASKAEDGTDVRASQSHEGSAQPKHRFRNLMGRMKMGRSFSEADREEPKADWGRLLTAREGGHHVSFTELVDTYKNYVASGQAAADKLKGDTPPPERKKKTKVRAILSHWKEERRKHSKSTDDDAFMDYERVWNQLCSEEADYDAADSAAGGKLWIGKDYVNFIFKDFTDLDMPFMDFIDRGSTCRMPWHDIHGIVYGSSARDVARHFIQRWNAAKIEKCKNDERYPFLLPKSYTNVHIPRVFRRLAHKCNVQIVRSSCLWSTGMNNTEDSIQQAYLHMIANAEHYIYIENQFFVSMIESADVHNEISKALLYRIVKAHNAGERFRVYVNLPLMPAFEGQIGATGGSALQAVLYWSYQSISNGPHSLLSCLAREVEDPSRYIVFTGLRQHDELSGKLITELLYIHSKLMIVDDRQAIMGSANINDRSQLGKRDSEVCFFVEDTEFSDARMDGKPFKAGKFCGSLRRWLFREHLGLLNDSADARKPEATHLNEAGKRIDVTDPVTDDFYLHVFLRTASRNTDIFEKVFRCLPTDEVFSFDELGGYQQQIPLAEYNPKAAKEQLGKVQGTLVLFPTRFLSNSNLAPSITTKEGMAPSALFT